MAISWPEYDNGHIWRRCSSCFTNGPGYGIAITAPPVLLLFSALKLTKITYYFEACQPGGVIIYIAL